VTGERGPTGDHGQAGDVGKRGPRGPRGRDASWFKNAAPYFGSVVIAIYVLVSGHNSDDKIVSTGRAVIENGCHFYNKRAHELRGILQNGLKNQRKQYEKGALPKARYEESVKYTKAAIDRISLRDCEAAANHLKAD